MVPHYRPLIGGTLWDCSAESCISALNPATGEVIGTFPDCGQSEVDAAVAAARRAYLEPDWRQSTFRERASLLLEIATLIEDNATMLSQLETLDTGKPIKESTLIDIPSAAAVFRDCASMADALWGSTLPHAADLMSYTVYEPLGVVGLITPWNYPLLMAAWKLAAALAAGNAMVLKPSEQASLSVLALAELLAQSSVPHGIINIVPGRGAGAGRALASHPGIDKLFFTGGTASGCEVLSLCARNITPSVVELGGKSPTILCADSPLERSVNSILTTIFMNQGATCVAGSRLYIERSVYQSAVELLVQKSRKLRLGPGLSPSTDMGPLISQEHCAELARRVDAAVAAGATLLVGGSVPLDPELQRGAFYLPTILADVTPAMPIFREELFGPVLLVFPFDDIEQVIRMANDSEYGLAASIWTQNCGVAARLVRELSVGTVWVNTFGSFAAQVPFGGFRRSGFGKELGREGLQSYCRQKSVTMDISIDQAPLVAHWYGV